MAPVASSSRSRVSEADQIGIRGAQRRVALEAGARALEIAHPQPQLDRELRRHQVGRIAPQHGVERFPRFERTLELDQAARLRHRRRDLPGPRREAGLEHGERLLALAAPQQLLGEAEEEARARLFAHAAAQLVQLCG